MTWFIEPREWSPRQRNSCSYGDTKLQCDLTTLWISRFPAGAPCRLVQVQVPPLRGLSVGLHLRYIDVQLTCLQNKIYMHMVKLQFTVEENIKWIAKLFPQFLFPKVITGWEFSGILSEKTVDIYQHKLSSAFKSPSTAAQTHLLLPFPTS